MRRIEPHFFRWPRRWVVERIFSWFGRNRRLAKEPSSLSPRTDRNQTTRALVVFLSQALNDASALENY
jgi:transposase